MSEGEHVVAGPLPLQVVFQGGGAKICVLMAVCDVLQDYHNKGTIQLTRLAGSSAGAIAATMLASGVPMSVYRERVRALGSEYVELMNVSPLAGRWRVLRGQPYFSRLNLRALFDKLISKDSDLRSVGDLQFDPQLYYTDLLSLRAQPASHNEPIPSALAKSCRFPLAFSGFDSDDLHVDGGLGMNLPVDDLKMQEADKGSVIAISFREEFEDLEDKNLVSYAQRLFAAAIQSGVYRSEASLGPNNVFQARTAIGTFDFDLAITDGLGLQYDQAREVFKSWFEAWLRDHAPKKPSLGANAQRLIHPTITTTPWRPAIIRDLADRVMASPCADVLSVSEYDEALFDDVGTFTGKYISKCRMSFRIIRPTNVMQFTFQTGRGGSFAEVNLGCAITESSGNSLQFVPHVEDLSRDFDKMRTYRVFFQFDEPLAPDSNGQPYYLEYEYESEDPFPDLGKSIETCTLTQKQGNARQVTIAVAFPRFKFQAPPKYLDFAELPKEKLTALGYNLTQWKLARSEQMTAGDCISHMNLRRASNMYWITGRRALNVGLGETIGLAIE